MDPQTRQMYQARVQQLISSGYPPDSAQQVALQEISAQGGGQSGQNGAATSLAANMPGAGSAASGPTGAVVPSPQQTPPMSGAVATGAGSRNVREGGPSAPTPGTAAASAPAVAASVAGPNNPAPVGGGGAPPSAAASDANGFSTNPALSDQASFGLGPNEDLLDWGSKVFRNGNPDLYDPLKSGSPWGQFLLSRYSPQTQAQLAEGLLTGHSPEGGSAAFAHDTLANAALGGGAGASSTAGLRDAFDAISNFGSHGATPGMNQDQANALGGAANNNANQANLIRAGMHGYGGGWGAQYMDQVLNSMYTQAQNNPSTFGPGQWGKAVLGKFGIQ